MGVAVPLHGADAVALLGGPWCRARYVGLANTDLAAYRLVCPTCLYPFHHVA